MRENAEEPPIDELAQLRVDFLEQFDVFGPYEQREIILGAGRKPASDKINRLIRLWRLHRIFEGTDLQRRRAIRERYSREKCVLETRKGVIPGIGNWTVFGVLRGFGDQLARAGV